MTETNEPNVTPEEKSPPVEIPPVVEDNKDEIPIPLDEYSKAKIEFSELYPKWNSLSEQEQDSEEGKALSAKLTALHSVIEEHEQPDEEEEKPQHILDQENYKTDMGEKEVQPKHQNISAPEHYLGSERVNPDNPMLEHMNPELYEQNKNRENR